MPPKKKTAESLQDVLSALRTKDKVEIGAFDGFEMTPEGLTTGNLTLDSLTGIDGFPKGRVTECIGPPSSGKTTSALQAAAQVQQAGGTVFFADFERSLDPVYCAALGLDVKSESFLYMKPEYFEQGANAFRRLVRTGELSLGIFDSVATMITKHELEADTGAVQVADRAKMMHQFLRQLNPELSRTGTAAVFLNHLLDVVDTSPVGRKLAAQGIQRKTSPGGKALPFYSSMRIEFKQIGNLRSEEMDVLSNEKVDKIRQTKVQATVVKNKVADPFKSAELRVRFGKGFSQAHAVVQVLVAYKVIKKNGAWYEIKDPDLRGDVDVPKYHGEDALLEAIESDPAWQDRLEKIARDLIEEHGNAALVEVDASKYDEHGMEKGVEVYEDEEDLDEVLGGGGTFAGQKVNTSTGEISA